MMASVQVLNPPSVLMHRFSEFLTEQMGLHFPPERWSDLMRGMTSAALEFRFEDLSECLQWLLSKPLNQNQIEILASHLTIGETYFFRDSKLFEALQTHILPALIDSRRQSGRRLRLWSAACSTGEEAYSIAILIQRLIPDYQQWNITILGTDINPHALRKAAKGIYGDWSFRNSPPWLRERYFLHLGGERYQIAPQLQHMVTFSYLNLAEEVYPSLANNTHAMDIIFCRNLLMYFKPGLAAKVVRQHFQSLLDGGCLIVSPAEIPPNLFAQWEIVNFPGATFYRKNTVHSAWAAASVSPAPHGITELEKPCNDVKPHPVRQIPDHNAALNTQLLPPVSHYQQALTYYRLGQYRKAAALIDQCAAEQKDNSEIMNLMARIQADQGELTTAMQWCNRAIAANRVNPSSYYLMAVIFLELKQPEEARQALKRTLYLDQDFVMAHFMLGNLYRSQSRFTEADKHFATTLSLLKGYSFDDILPESEGMTSGRLLEIIQSFIGKREQHGKQ